MSDEPDTPDPSATDGEETTDESSGNESDDSSSDGRTKIRFKAYDLEVEAESEDASFDEMAETLTDEFDKIRRDALIGEYEEIERENLHSIILGGD